MKHVYQLSDAQLERPSVVTIGVFDGVHRGHQTLIEMLVAEARQMDRAAVVVTFFPHPDKVLRQLSGRYYLTTPEQRAQVMLELGVDCVVTHPFDDEVRHMRAAAFVDNLLRHLNMAELWVGVDFAMGYQREGNVAFLQAQGAQKGFKVAPLELITHESAGGVINSSRIRELLNQGEVEKVRDWLGRGYALTGEVVHGDKRGRELGFPTANMAIWDEQIIPANGIYASWVHIGDERFMAATSVGIRPTFDGKIVTVEPYILDFNREIYGQQIAVTFEKRLRAEEKFDGIEPLIAQMHRDVANSRAYLQAQLSHMGK